MYRYLFDNNIYRHLSTSKNGLALEALSESFCKIELLEKISSNKFTYKLTPFTVIEALGIVVPDYQLEIPDNLNNNSSIPELVNYILNKCYEFYLTCPELSKEHLIEKANIQSRYTDTSTNAKKFEQLCIYEPIAHSHFETYIKECFAIDALCKQDYTKDMAFHIADYLLCTNLYHNKITGLSKYRLVKQHWRYIAHEYKDDNTLKPGRFEAFDKSMKLKKNRDYLDCDLIHLVCIGDYLNGDFHPVIAFTCDNKDIVIDRIISYKSINNTYIHKITDDMRSKAEFIYNKWQPGIVVFCNEDGTIIDHLEVSNLPPLNDK